MKRFILSVCALMIFAVAPASATVRSNGMGIDQDDTMDYGNIYAFPHLTAKYANILAAVINGDQSTGETELLYNIFGDKTLELAWYSATQDIGGVRASNVSSDATGWLGLGNVDGLHNPDQKLLIGLSMPMGSGSIGVAAFFSSRLDNEVITYDDGDNDFSPADSDVRKDNKSSNIGVNLGYGMEEVGPFSSVDIGVGFQFGSAESLYTNALSVHPFIPNGASDNIESVTLDGASDINVAVRAIKEFDSGSSAVINVRFGTSKAETTATKQIDGDFDGDYAGSSSDTDDVVAISDKSSGFGVRVAFNEPVGDDGIMVLFVGLESDSSEREGSLTIYNGANLESYIIETSMSKNTELRIPLGVGFEDTLNDTFVLRMGVSKDIIISQAGDPFEVGEGDLEQNPFSVDKGVLYDTAFESREDTPNADASVSVGLGGVWGNWYADWVVSTDLLFNGPTFLTNASNTFAGELEIGITF